MEENTPRRYRGEDLNYGQRDQYCKSVMIRGLMKKFESNEKCHDRLMSTGSATIINATNRDTILGTGLDIGDVGNVNASKSEGMNELGLMLMGVRENLELLTMPSLEIIDTEGLESQFSYECHRWCI